MTFEEIKFTPNPHGGWSSRTKINDTTSVSVVCGSFAYCAPRENLSNPLEYGLYEIAVFKDNEFTREYFSEDHYDDVMGFVTKEDVMSIINKIKES